MVMGNGTARARSTAYTNQNTSGGPKKAGLPPTVGINASVSAIYRKKIGCALQCPFVISTTNQCARIGAPAGIIKCR
jgi:hypothetical protein